MKNKTAHLKNLQAECEQLLSQRFVSIKNDITQYLDSDTDRLISQIESQVEMLKLALFNKLQLEQYPSTFKEWMQQQFDTDQLKDMCNHGVNTGYSGLTYYHETGRLYERYAQEIWDKLEETRISFGHKNIMETIAGFGGADNVCDGVTLNNLLVWFIAEETARELTENEED